MKKLVAAFMSPGVVLLATLIFAALAAAEPRMRAGWQVVSRRIEGREPQDSCFPAQAKDGQSASTLRDLCYSFWKVVLSIFGM